MTQIRHEANRDSHYEDLYNRRNCYVSPGLTVLWHTVFGGHNDGEEEDQ